MRRVICLILLVLNVGFIWGNSMLDGEQSKAISDRVIAMLVKVFPIEYSGSGDADEPDMNFLVRKAAHAAEFAVLGAVSVLFLYDRRKPLGDSLPKAVLAGVLVALTDETIQLYHARTSSVKDVWLDSGGLAVGILVIALLLSQLQRRRGEPLDNSTRTK